MNRAAGGPTLILGSAITGSTALRWGFAHHTDLVTLDDGRHVVVKRFEGADGGAELRRSVTLARRLHAAGIPTPSVLSADPHSDPPVLVLEFVDGTTGADWLDTQTRARTLARTMGSLAARFGDLPVQAGDARDGAWSDAQRLAEASTRWLEQLGAPIAPGTREGLRRVIARLPDFYDATEPRLAHGDFVPVNVLLGPDGSLASVLDLGAWRVADPWLDVAWWGWVVRSFHPEAWAASWPTMLASAGIPDDDPSEARLHRLAMIRGLEWAVSSDDPAAPSLLAASVAWRIAG